ncbi:MAG: type VII secretion integral membrane protein EccD [Phycicoccus sp.]
MVEVSIVAPRRVTVVAPHTRADVSLPVQLTVAEATHELAALIGLDAGDDADAWVLTSAGGSVLEEERSVAAAGVRDGDVLLLRPDAEAVPPVVFDDVVDALATTIRRSTVEWTGTATRWAVLAGGATVAQGGLLVLLWSGPPWTAATRAGAVVAAVLLLCGWLLARSVGHHTVALCCDGIALGYALTAALTASLGPAPLAASGERQVLAAGAATVVVSAICLGALGARSTPVGAAAAVGAVAVLGAVPTVLLDVPPGWVAAVLTTVLVLGLPSLATWSMAWARLPRPTVPRDEGSFRSVPVPGDEAEVVDRVMESRSALTALTSVVSAVVAANAVVLSTHAEVRGSAWMPWFALVSAAVLASRSRHLVHTAPRVVMLAGTAVAACASVAALVRDVAQPVLAALVAVLVPAVALGLLLVVRVPPREPSPYRARALDLLEMAALAALVPLCLGVLDVYALVRGLGG